MLVVLAMSGEDDGPRPHSTHEGFSFAHSDYCSDPSVRWTDKAGRHTLRLVDRMVAGSANEAAIVVADPTVSRVHAELEVKKDGIWVHDLGSRNGTFVEGIQVKSARVPNRGRIHLGAALVSVVYGPPGESVEVWEEDHFGPLIGATLVMRRLFARIARAAATQSSVLIHGETGTGKELVARAVHEASPRAAGPFVVVDCAAIPENLVESQLFGHAKGAFTGAISTRVGDVESANGGTLFLDEVGELPLSVQPKLLRVLEARTLRRVGETEERSADVRIVSATHRDLGGMVNAGAFREDLYFRLAVVPLSVPPLRERLEDIPSLVKKFAGARGDVSPALLAELSKRPWLGNVRELRNFVELASAMGTAEALTMTTRTGEARLSPPVSEPSAGAVVPVAFAQALADFREQWNDHGEREYLRQLLERHGRNVAAAAVEAGVDRTHLYRLLRKHKA